MHVPPTQYFIYAPMYALLLQKFLLHVIFDKNADSVDTNVM